MLQHRLRAKSTDELNKIISLQGEQSVDGVNVCNPLARGCLLSMER
jgi:hypothetical protein